MLFSDNNVIIHEILEWWSHHYCNVNTAGLRLPSAWFEVSSTHMDNIVIVKVAEGSPDQPAALVTHCLTLETNFAWKLCVHGQVILTAICAPLSAFPSTLHLADLHHLLSTVDKLHVCACHPDQQFVDMVEAREGKQNSPSGDTTAFVDRKILPSNTCEMLTFSVKCAPCVRYRGTLRAIHHRWSRNKQNSCESDVSSHTNDRWLTSPQKKAKTSKQTLQSAEAAVKYLKHKIQASTEKLGVNIDDSLHSGLVR